MAAAAVELWHVMGINAWRDMLYILFRCYSWRARRDSILSTVQQNVFVRAYVVVRQRSIS